MHCIEHRYCHLPEEVAYHTHPYTTICNLWDKYLYMLHKQYILSDHKLSYYEFMAFAN